MKEELQSKLVEILTSIQTAAGKASDFAMEQLPDIAQSYAAYGRAWASFEMAVAGLLLLCALIGNFFFVRWMKRDDAWEASPALIVAVPATGALAFWMLETTRSAFFVWFAPKVWLLKEIATLLK